MNLKVLLTATSFLPTYGGPAFSVSRLALALAAAGVKVGLWAPDGSAAGSSVIRDHTLGSRFGGSLASAVETFEPPDVIHDNGIWLPHNHHLAQLAARRHIPRLVSLRGMLEPWARNHKRAKKKIAWLLYQRRDLRFADHHHTTSAAEAKNMQRLGIGVSICIIPNGVDMPKAQLVTLGQSKRKTHKTALFLSRIHPKKGLPMLIEAWARVFPDGWRLVIAGPDERGHRSEIETLVRKYDLSDRVTFLGLVDPEKRDALYETADLFVLPTHSENFGIVVAEALAHGVPVLTTKGAPWSMLEEEGCGWWVDVSVEGLAEGLRRATACDRQTLAAMGTRGRAFVAREYSWGSIAKQFVALYEELLSARPWSSA